MIHTNFVKMLGLLALVGVFLYITPLYLWPALAVITIAVVTRRVLIALAFGVYIAALIITKGNLVGAAQLSVSRFIGEALAKDHVYIFIFLLNLGFLIELMTHAGAMLAYTRTLGMWLKNRRSVETTSLILSSLFFVDDYLSNLLVGNIMRPLIDAYGIARVKLAYLLDSVAASLCVIIPATSWVAMILVQLQVSGISENIDKNPLIQADPYFVYLSLIPFLFYPVLSVLGAWLVVQGGVRWGLMKEFEDEVDGHQRVTVLETADEGSLLDFIIPIGSFIAALIVGILKTGNYYLFGGTHSLIQAVQTADIFGVLLYSSIIANCFALLWYAIQRKNMGSLIIHSVKQAFNLMKNSLLLLSLAWTLSSFFRFELQAGQQLATYLHAIPFKSLIPFLIFLLSTMISSITGTAWGTISLLFPLVVPLIVSLNDTTVALITMPLLLPSLAAVISGAIAGGQISPIADSACMASMSAGVPLLDHIQTQQQYVIPVWLGTITGYILVVVLPWSLHARLMISWVTALSMLIVFNVYANKS
jgi:tetracycline resistance efflux pump